MHAAVAHVLLHDSIAVARRLGPPWMPATWPPPDFDRHRTRDRAGIDALLKSLHTDPDHPVHWHRRAREAALADPRTSRIYWAIRQSLWRWEEFNALSIYARRILETIIELARDEGFPWYLAVSREQVCRLARLGAKTHTRRMMDLEHFVITRPARRIVLLPPGGANSLINRAQVMPRWPGQSNNFGVELSQPLRDIPQWLVRHRRGRPGNARRGAWWINYDLLCETQRVLPCFEVGVNTLPRHYHHRNHRPAIAPGFDSDDAFRAMERVYSTNGPPPDPGMRVARWRGM